MTDQTRRTWIVNITQAAAGLGLVRHIDGRAASSIALPPGVYDPSSDHLGHALMSADRYHPIPPGCPTDYVRQRSGPYEPLFFSKPDFALVSRFVELMLGESETVQEVAEWIDLRVSVAASVQRAEARLSPLHRALANAYYGSTQDRTPKPSQAVICREGIEWMSSQQFLSLGAEQQIAVLHSISDEKQNENAGSKFFKFMKSEVIRGFYTSRAGLRELDYKGNAFYARSPACSS